MITHNGKPYMVFDTHTHAFPDAIAAATMDLLSQKAGIPHYHDGTHAALCAHESRGGADRFLLLPIATKPGQMRSVNRWAADRIGGRMLAFGSVHPDDHGLDGELDRVCDFGLRGIKLHPEYQQFYVDDERCLPLYESIFKRGLILVLHMGVDLGYEPPVHGTPEGLAKVLDRFPEGQVIAAHMGGFRMEAEVRDHLAGRRNLWMDTAYVADKMAPGALSSLARQHGADRVLFATDAPWTDFDASLQAVLNAGFTDNELTGILYDNAARLLGVNA